MSSDLPRTLKSPLLKDDWEGTQKVFVIFGGDTSERQVSLMSGTNVWLNLQAFDDVSIQIQGDLHFLNMARFGYASFLVCNVQRAH